MSASVLVAYATRYGSTQEVAEVGASTLRERGLAVDIQPMRKVRTLDQYRAVVLEAPLFMFHRHKDALSFLARHRAALTARPVAIFALGPTKSPTDEKEWQGSREQIEKELAQFPWLKSVALEPFGGKFPRSSPSPTICCRPSRTCQPAIYGTGRRLATGRATWLLRFSLLCHRRARHV